ncbi:MAG: ATP-binding cassette domain-containing protein [Acidobacteriaceae bacterium]|nr:ATP-binding cassette domain-containing protein [Acidobacteriaceae bacterium]
MADESQSLVEFRNVSLQYGNVWALKQVSFRLNAGETRIIFGAAGSGKTTLLKAVIGLVDVDEGEIRLFGENVTERKEQDLFGLRGRAGFLFQEGGLFDSLTIGENVEYPLANRQLGVEPQSSKLGDSPETDFEARVRQVLRFVELEQTYSQFPSEVSGGMRRRVGIARATVTEPPLVLYDSPTAGLDPITANLIMALLAKERETHNTASLIVTHRYQDGELMANFRFNLEKGELDPISENDGEFAGRTKFMVMKEGEVVFVGSREELEASEDAYVKRFVRHEEHHAG